MLVKHMSRVIFALAQDENHILVGLWFLDCSSHIPSMEIDPNKHFITVPNLACVLITGDMHMNVVPAAAQLETAHVNRWWRVDAVG